LAQKNEVIRGTRLSCDLLDPCNDVPAVPLHPVVSRLCRIKNAAVDSFALAHRSGFTDHPHATWSAARQVYTGNGRPEICNHWMLSALAVLVYLREQVVDRLGLQAIWLVQAHRHFSDDIATHHTRYYLLKILLG
jgi:hypothetical protein